MWQLGHGTRHFNDKAKGIIANNDEMSELNESFLVDETLEVIITFNNGPDDLLQERSTL